MPFTLSPKKCIAKETKSKNVHFTWYLSESVGHCEKNITGLINN
jgi:hypothetical protein